MVVTAGFALLPIAPSSAAKGVPDFSCTDNAVYTVNGGDPHTITKINSLTGGVSANGAFNPAKDSNTVNALALRSGGQYIYAFDRKANKILRFDASNSSQNTYDGASNDDASSVVAGAINPATGIYYYASGGSSWTVNAFNTNTNVAIGKVATISGTGLAGNGDFAFDALGNLFIVSNANGTAAGTLARVNQALPTVAGNAALTITVLATTPDNSGQYHSMAFDSSGALVIGSGGSPTKLTRVDPSTGTSMSTTSFAGAFADMASCSLPSSASANVNLPSGRYNNTDQFGVKITGNGVTTGNSGTTEGVDTGLQNTSDEVAGPVVVLPSKTYTITQTAAGGTNLGNYTTTWKCVDGSNATVSSGTGQTGTFTMPGTSGANVTCTFTNIPKFPAIELKKTASAINDLDGNGPDAGDTITYDFKVTNTGQVVLNPVTVSDPKLGAITCPNTALAVGASLTCTSKTYTLTQADVDAGKVDNTATASGTSPTGVVVKDPDTVSTTVTGKSGIELTKTASEINDLDSNGPDAGDTITYNFKVKNTGTVTLNPVTVNDPLFTGAAPTVTCPSGALAPGATVTCSSKTYTLTQADVDAGKVDNTATATGTTPGGTKVTDPDSTTTPVVGKSGIELTKTASAINDLDGNGPDAGDTITYNFKVKNTGTVVLNPVTVNDPLFTGAAPTVTCPSGALAPGATVTCSSKTYTLTQADVDAGKVDNTATATGTTPGGTKVTDPDSTSTPVVGKSGIELTKTASAINDLDGNGPDAGDTITYNFKVKNTGTVTLNPVTVNDPLFTGTSPNVTCPSGALAPGATVTCSSKTYTLTQADVDAGKVDNTATATGTTPGGTKVTDPDSTTTPVVGKSGIELTKTASAINDLDSNGPDAGDTITYNFKVKNTGTVALNPVTVNDPLFAGASPNITCPAGELLPGASVSCTSKTYTLTQADVNNGKVDNTATATGTTPGGTKVTDDDDTTTPVVVSKTNIRVTKTVNDATPHAGDVVTYTLKVTNDGPASAADVVLKDVLPSGVTFVSADAPCTQAGSTVTCAFGTLAAGATRTVTIKAKVNALAPAGSGDQHLIDVQKTEAQLDVDPGQQRTLSVSCAPGYIATDGSGRIDHVDQGTGTLGSLRVLESRAVGLDGWQVTVVNQATGRAQAKVFAVCVKAQTESVNGHTHQLQVSGVVTTTRSITGATTETLTCAPGQQPIQPGYVLNGTANVPTSYPAGTDGWTFVVAPGTDGSATSATFSIRCLDRSLSVVNGHTHQLNLNEIRQTVTVQPGQVAEFTLSCADDAKGIVAGYDMDPGLVNLGNDPRPKIRVFKFFNPTAQPLNADLWLLCMGTRTTGADANPRVVNTASVTTATDETTTSDNSDSAEFNVDSSTVTPGSVSIAGSTVALSNGKVRAAVTCAAGTKTCKGTAVMIASKTQRINGKLVRKGTVLAKVSYKIAASRKATLVLRPTAVGRTALRSTSLKTAKLRVGATTKVVRIKR